MAKASDDTWRWGKALIACFDELKTELEAHQPPVVDREIIPSFTGSPDGLVLWLICARKTEVARLEKDAAKFRALFADAMSRHQFPQSAVETLWLGFTSQQQIEAGGGRFAFFS